MSARKQNQGKPGRKKTPNTWQPMKARYAGRVDDIVQKATGKLSGSFERGEPTKKPRGHG